MSLPGCPSAQHRLAAYKQQAFILTLSRCDLTWKQRRGELSEAPLFFQGRTPAYGRSQVRG